MSAIASPLAGGAILLLAIVGNALSGAMPAKLSLSMRPRVMPGLAKLVELVAK